MRFAIALTLFLGAAATAQAAPIAFIEDDYPRALAEARSRKVPLFVDTYTQWCHTCRFMRAWVFPDPALAKQAGRFVWLSIDVEREQNRGFAEKFPTQLFPTLWVIDAASERAGLKWPGSATVPELEKLLDEGELAVRGGSDDLSRARRAAAIGRPDEAVAAWREALAHAPAERRPRVVEALVSAEEAADQLQACAELAVDQAPKLARGRSYANVIGAGLECAEDAPADAPWRAPAIAKLTPLALSALALPGLLADDRSILYSGVIHAGDRAAARATAREWLAFLEAEAARAATPEARASFDAHRASAAIAAGEPARAIAALQASERDLPRDYNPPARLAVVYAELGRLDEALAASDRALARVYGPMRIRVFDVKAGVEERKGDRAAARRSLQSAVEFARTLPPSPRRAAQVARLEERIARLADPAAR